MTDRPSNESEKVFSSASGSDKNPVVQSGVSVKKQHQKITMFFQKAKPEN